MSIECTGDVFLPRHHERNKNPRAAGEKCLFPTFLPSVFPDAPEITTGEAAARRRRTDDRSAAVSALYAGGQGGSVYADEQVFEELRLKHS